MIVLNVIVRFLTVIFALNVAQSYIDIANAASLHKPYDCGHSKCPGYALFVELAKKSLKLQEPYRGRARQIKDALARKHYHSDDERLKDAQAYIWISIGVIVISLIILLVQIMK